MTSLNELIHNKLRIYWVAEHEGHLTNKRVDILANSATFFGIPADYNRVNINSWTEYNFILLWEKPSCT